MPTENIKKEAHRLLDRLPDKSTWDDLMYQIYVRQAIEVGLAESVYIVFAALVPVCIPRHLTFYPQYQYRLDFMMKIQILGVEST